MSPEIFLCVVLCLLATAVVVDMTLRLIRRGRLRSLAHKWHMHFAPGDRLRLALRVAPLLPVPGAADVRVRDMIFRTENNQHQYVFTIDYTVGVVRGKVGRSRVAGFQEPVTRGGRLQPHPPVLLLAPQSLCLADAYSHVRDALSKSDAIAASDALTKS